MTNFDKQYNSGNVSYNYSRFSKKWEFSFVARSGSIMTLLVSAGGKENAHKVASILEGAIKRNGSIDGLARANIERILA
jgi:hypothetical protein